MEGHPTRRRRPRSRLHGTDDERQQLFDRAKELAQKQLHTESTAMRREHDQQVEAREPYRKVEDQQRAMRQRNEQALRQSRSRTEAEVNQKVLADRQRLVRNVASQRKGRQPNMRQGSSSPSTGQGVPMLGRMRKRGNPRRYLLRS